MVRTPACWPLQFGHGVAAVDDNRIAHGISRARGLQFGHGVAAVDERRGRATSRRSRCFNSATALLPWMTPVVVHYYRHSQQLQFGHGVAAVDDARGREEPPEHGGASIR